MTVDVDARREELLALRARLLTAAEDLVHDDDEDGELNSAGGDQHLADHATDMVDREIDDSLEENADRVVHEIDEALRQLDDGSYGTCTAVGRKSRKNASPRSRTQHCACGTSAPGSTVERARPDQGCPVGRHPCRLRHERAATDLECRALARRGAWTVVGARYRRGHRNRGRSADEMDRVGEARAR